MGSIFDNIVMGLTFLLFLAVAISTLAMLALIVGEVENDTEMVKDGERVLPWTGGSSLVLGAIIYTLFKVEHHYARRG